MVVFDVSNAIAGPLTAEYDGYSFNTDVDPVMVFMQFKDFVGVSACDIHIDRLDWYVPCGYTAFVFFC